MIFERILVEFSLSAIINVFWEPLENDMEKSTLILSNSLKSLSYWFEFLPFLRNPLTNTTSSSNHIPLWKESVSPLFSNIKYSTQTSNFLLCHIPEELAWSIVSPFPWILPSPYCFLLLCQLLPLQKLPSPWLPLKLYIFYASFNRKVLERSFKTQWISAPLSYSWTHDHSTEDVYMKVINACLITKTNSSAFWYTNPLTR